MMVPGVQVIERYDHRGCRCPAIFRKILPRASGKGSKHWKVHTHPGSGMVLGGIESEISVWSPIQFVWSQLRG